eukprot:m.65386 g.65386  ORF g.65386 m.65386 type:complete len:174 (+) comp49791_c0_seq2:19-540(+)
MQTSSVSRAITIFQHPHITAMAAHQLAYPVFPSQLAMQNMLLMQYMYAQQLQQQQQQQQTQLPLYAKTLSSPSASAPSASSDAESSSPLTDMSVAPVKRTMRLQRQDDEADFVGKRAKTNFVIEAKPTKGVEAPEQRTVMLRQGELGVPPPNLLTWTLGTRPRDSTGVVCPVL